MEIIPKGKMEIGESSSWNECMERFKVLFRNTQTQDGDNDARKWENIPPEIFGMIMEPLTLQEKIGVIPLVCKKWEKAVKAPYSWSSVDLEEWTKWFRVHWKVDKMLRLLMRRSLGQMNKLCVCNVYDPNTIDFIAENLGSSLKILKISGCQFTDSWLKYTANNLVNVTYLDLSYCNNISPAGLELVGRTCLGLTRLNRNMRVLDFQRALSQTEEARVIATTMPKLEHLEMKNRYMTTESALLIISACKKLRNFDIEGCWLVRLDEDYLKTEFPELRVFGPGSGEQSDDWILDYYDDEVDFSGSGELSDDDEDDELEARVLGSLDLLPPAAP